MNSFVNSFPLQKRGRNLDVDVFPGCLGNVFKFSKCSMSVSCDIKRRFFVFNSCLQKSQQFLIPYVVKYVVSTQECFVSLN